MNKTFDWLEFLELYSWNIQLSCEHSPSYSRMLLDSFCQVSKSLPLQWPYFRQRTIDAVTKQGEQRFFGKLIF